MNIFTLFFIIGFNVLSIKGKLLKIIIFIKNEWLIKTKKFCFSGELEKSYVTIKLKTDNSYSGGTIISKNYIVTSAHSLKSNNPSNYVIRTGSDHRDHGGNLHTISKIIKHKNFHQMTHHYINDIA